MMDANKHTLELAESILAKPEGWDVEILELAAGFKNLVDVGPHVQNPHTCPVCNGTGLVPTGFYELVKGLLPTIHTTPEKCRSCDGSGVIWRKAKE